MKPKSNIRLIGITGGIGSGKSVVSRILRLNGYNVYDCDTEARRLMEDDKRVIESITGILGDEAYGESDGPDRERKLNKGYVAAMIFGNEQKRLAVNCVVHKRVTEDILNHMLNDQGEILFCETAILNTSRIDLICDEIWLVTADDEERVERVMLRNGFSESEVRKRMATQKNEFDRLDGTKIRVINNGSRDLLLPQIYELINRKKICLEKS